MNEYKIILLAVIGNCLTSLILRIANDIEYNIKKSKQKHKNLLFKILIIIPFITPFIFMTGFFIYAKTVDKFFVFNITFQIISLIINIVIHLMMRIKMLEHRNNEINTRLESIINDLQKKGG